MRKKKIETRTWTIEAVVEKSEIVTVRRKRPVTIKRCDNCGYESTHSSADPPESLLPPVRVSGQD